MCVGAGAGMAYLLAQGGAFTKGPKSMPILPFPPRKPIAATLEPYFTAEPVSSARRLRPLSALEQMYAYWGSDRA